MPPIAREDLIRGAEADAPKLTVGVLAVQGAFDAHRRVIERLGQRVRLIRLPEELDGLDAVILPGGESTTMSKLLLFNGLFEPLQRAIAAGLPTLGTCAGMIIAARTVLDGRADQRSLGSIDISVRRNAFGRQVDSFETALPVTGLDGGSFPAVFIRAPVVTGIGPSVRVLAEIDGDPVFCVAGDVFVTAFHPELSGDDRIHRLLIAAARAVRSTITSLNA